MHQHHAFAELALCQLGDCEIGGIGLGEGEIACLCDCNGGVESCEAHRLVGPDIGAQAQAMVGAVDVERREIAASAAVDGEVAGEIRLAAAHLWNQRCRIGRVAPFSVVVSVMKLVGKKVQARAGSNLRQRQRQAGLAGDFEKAGQQQGRARDLIGLRRAFYEAAQE